MLEVLSLPNFWWVLGGAGVLGATLGAVGSFRYLRKEALLGDVLSHAALPGVMTAFLIFHSREPAILLSGAVVACVLTQVLLQMLSRHTKLSQDALLAILLSGTFAIGIFQLSLIQKSGRGNISGLDKILFGQAAAIRLDDLFFYIVVALVLLSGIWAFFRGLKVSTFDPLFGRTVGISVGVYEVLLGLATAVATAISLDLAGVVLVAALLMTPSAASRQWTRSTESFVLLSSIFGAIAGVGGTIVSSLGKGMPTGPWIVMVATFLFALSLLFSPERGMLFRYLRRRRMRRAIRQEDLLRTMHGYLEASEFKADAVPLAYLRAERALTELEVSRTLEEMKRAGFVSFTGDSVFLTKQGSRLGEKLTRYHRLWETYLSTYTPIPETHLHADAEEAEHFLDDTLGEALALYLQNPLVDPHGKPIPVEVVLEEEE